MAAAALRSAARAWRTVIPAVARDLATLEELRAELGGSFTAVPADAADPTMAGQLINAYHPRILVPPRALAR